jgi:hypothetical protein
MDRNTGTYQISFKNIECTDLTNIEVGVLPWTETIYGDFSKKYGINFAGYQLLFKKLFESDEYYMSKQQKQTYQYKGYKQFISNYNILETCKASTLTIRLNTQNGIMIFLLILHRCIIYVI